MNRLAAVLLFQFWWVAFAAQIPSSVMRSEPSGDAKYDEVFRTQRGVNDVEELLYPEGFFFKNGYGQIISLDHAQDPELTYNHMPKAGGSFARALIAAAVPPGQIRIEDEFESLHPDDEKRFTIGSIRNPCEYYGSLYSYGADGHGAFRTKIPQAKQFLYESPIHFPEWLDFIMADAGDTRLGVLSHRFAVSYAGVHGAIAGPINGITPEAARSVKDVLKHFSTSAVDCWVKTENILDDLKLCLQKFEDSRGGIVDWARFADAARNSNHNPSHHIACSELFNDTTKSLVNETDEELFELFGYTRCCEK